TISDHLTLLFSMLLSPPNSTLFPYTTLFRSQSDISSNRFYLTGLCRKLIAENDRSYHCVGHLPVLEYETEAARERVITRHFLELDRKSTRLNPVTVKSRMPSSA